ncbi:MAG: hypothetical protein VB022_08460 [Rikenellaceae bacterium]|nr:hypothetical protein [Rikenellaceae bacterium]
MKDEKDYIRDITEIRSMMERSSKFRLLSGWAGITAGILALMGAFVIYYILDFNPEGELQISGAIPLNSLVVKVLLPATVVLISALAAAFYFSYRKAAERGEKIWTPTTRRLLTSMFIPMATGGVLIIALLLNGLIGLAAPLTLIFYGLGLFGAGSYTLAEVRFLGLVEIGLGLAATFMLEYALLIWAIGFGLAHIIYGIYIYIKYEK